MQKETAISFWIFISKFFLLGKKNFGIGIFMILTFGLFSSSASAQLALEDFNSGIPSTWGITSNQTVTNNWGPSPAAGGYLSTPGATVNPASNNTVGSTAEYYLITPRFTTPSNTEIRFWTKQGNFQNRGTRYELRLSTSLQPDINSFIVVESWTEATLNVVANTWEEKIVPVAGIGAGTQVYLAFVAIIDQGGTTATNGDAWFVDNVRVIPSCAKVTGINSSMGANGGLITWAHATASNFEIQIVPTGGPINPTGEAVAGFSYNATGLNDGTTYDVYIKTICDGTTASAWAGPFQVTTSRLGLDCATPIVVPPTQVTGAGYTLSTNLSTFHPAANYTPMNSQGLSCQPVGQTQNLLLGDHAFLAYTPTTSGLVNVGLATNVNSSIQCYNSLASVFIFDTCNGIGTTANCLGALAVGSSSNVGTQGILPNVYLQAGQTYYFVISSPYQQNPNNPGASICFTFTLTQPSCSTPAGISYDNLAQTSARFSWANPQNLVSNWQYIAKPASAGPPTASDVLTSTTTNVNNLVSGLTPNTAYNFYVRSVCGAAPGTPGAWSIAFPFRTLCNVFPTPYSTNFNTATDTNPEPCWTILNLNGDNTQFQYSTDATQGAPQGNLARLSTFNPGSQTNDMLVSPQIHLDGVVQKQLRFKFKGFGGYTNSTGYVLGESSFSVKISTTGVGAGSFTTILLPLATYETGNNWVEKIIAIPANIVGDISIAWHVEPGHPQTSTNFYVDDVAIEDLPACSPPQYPGVTAGSITQNQAQFFWTPGINNSEWEIAVQPLNSGVPTVNGERVTNNPFLRTGLTASTRYEYYIRTYCDDVTKSVWVGPVPFNTLCDAQPVPYFESLNDNDVTTKKFCWKVDNRNNDGGRSQWTITGTEATIQARNLPFTPFESFDDYLITAQVNVVGTKMLKFKYKVAVNILNQSDRGNFEILMSSSPDMSNPTVLIPAHDFHNVDFVEDFVVFTGTGPAYFAFHLPANMSTPANTGVITIDDFSIEDVAPCPNPTLLTASNITTNSATLSWKKGYQETQWEIVIQSPGAGVPTGSGTVVNTNPTYNATGLPENTAFEYYVRAICGGTNGNSQWVGPFRFRTICTARPTPFIETFEADSPTESCWTIVNTNADAKEWDMNMPVNAIFGEQQAALNCFTNGKSDDWLITPTLTVQPNQRLRFYYKSHYEPVIGNDLKVKLSRNGVDISQFTTTLYDTDVTGTINNTDVKEMIINLTTITAPTNINIAFQVPPGTPGADGYRGSYVVIDNVSIENIPTCPAVTNLTAAVNTTFDTSSIINWTPIGSETSWEISLQPYGTPAPVGNTQPQYLRTATTHPYTLTGLTPSTRYQFYVRAICSSSSQSVWVGPFDILTKCDTSNLCTYTITLSNNGGGQPAGAFDVSQSGVVYQSLLFPARAPGVPQSIDYQVSLCRGIEWNLFWRMGGSVNSWPNAKITIKDQSLNVVFDSELAAYAPNTIIYKAVSNCAAVTCPQPTNVTINDLGVLSWTPGGGETQWEVFVQPVGLGAIPQSGVPVTNGIASYTPQLSDYIDPKAGTNEFFVRAVCGSTDKSYWTGPFVFIKNNEPQTAIPLTVNTNASCDSKGTKASFIGATASNVPTNCGGTNKGDIWYEFVATSKIHTVELSNWTSGSYFTNASQGVWPKVILSLYEVQGDGSLVEKACSENNSLTTMYSTELTVGTTYKIRVKLNEATNYDKKFDICVSTPASLCDVSNFNYGFEKLPMQSITGISTIFDMEVIPGWRNNTVSESIFFYEASNGGGIVPYEGSQCVQLIQDTNTTDPTIRGTYTEIETPAEVKKVKYSFAMASRISAEGRTLELWAGPPSGPYTLVTERHSATLSWALVTGDYVVPVGQPITRFLFRIKGNLGHALLDAAKFVPNVDIITKNPTLTCDQTSVSVAAEGTGEWVVDANNPAVTTIDTPQSQTATISGFTIPGTYTYFWKTRYCEKPFTVTYLGLDDLATVTSPVNYCLNEPAVPLTATAPDGFTLLWYTDATGGTGDVNAPTPLTDAVGTTTYYVSVVSPQGCIGARTPIEVIVNDLYAPVVTFKYDDTKYCSTGVNPVLQTAEGFTTGGTFAATPPGLSINPATGAVDLSTSTPGVYSVIYTINERVNGCNLAATSPSVSLQYEGPCPNIPRGISPNADGDNDTFDLSGMDVKKVVIFNRYGVEVYSHGEGYEKEWDGKSNNGDKLPDGTYFYSIQKADNTTVTGWVYINRQY